jgi:hypothetical protein
MAYLDDATLSAGADFLRRFRPCVCNYAVNFRLSLTSGQYFITPDGQYSTWFGDGRPGFPPYGLDPSELIPFGGRWFIGTETDCANKLDSDLALLARSGFNTLRIVGISPTFDSGGLTYGIAPIAYASLSSYLLLLKALLSKMASHDLKAILLIGNGNQWQQPELWRQFLRDVCGALSDNPTVLAYDLYNEPAWSYPTGPLTPVIDKLATSHWVADSYWTIKSVAPRHLVTLGMTTPEDVFEWDPALIQVDFVSHHFYAGANAGTMSPVATAMDEIASMLYWAKETSVRSWIIGETGFAGKDRTNYPFPVDSGVGSEPDQKAYVDFTLQRSLDCGCDGYSWWEYQEIKAGNDFTDYMGLVTKTNLDPTNMLVASEQQKPALSSFSAYEGLAPNPAAAVKPANYANPDVATLIYPVLAGTVFDQAGQPVLDASVRCKLDNGNARVFWTLSESGGSFTLFASDNSSGGVSSSYAYVSKPGYSIVNPTVAPNNCVLEAWRDASWSRRWMASDPGKLKFFQNSGAPLEWLVSPTDRFYVGDFDGDGSEELLCVQTGALSGNEMAMLKFDGSWRLAWTYNPSKGSGIYPYRQQLVVGDFDGDGADEVLGTDVGGNWLTLFKYQSSDWQWVWSNYPLNPNHPLKPYRNSLIAGNFNGGGGDFLLGSADGWTTLFQFSATKNDWQWIDSDYGPQNKMPLKDVRPYVGKLMVGDFDGDGRDEVLGLDSSGSWVTLFGMRSSDLLQWLTSNYGSAEAAMTGMVPYLANCVVGRFDGPGCDRVLAISSQSAMFGFDGEDFQRTWSSIGHTFAGLSVAGTERLFSFRARKEMPAYLLIIPTSGIASMIAFDPILTRR